ncbi:MAG: DNA-binding response regulator [Planctomycetes bacterium]|jgi:two-component system phosphate regulon response regulator PhoB|nr:DNA-binding response regulator [Planctomycetota bacterium]
MSSAPAATPVTPTGQKILVIEDEKALADVLGYNLRREGYDVTLAYDGQEGLKQASAKLPDLIVLDLMLPTISGTEVLRELRSSDRTREIPVIILTAKAEEADQVVGFTLGADDYVTKPFSVKVLIQRIKAVKRRSEGTTEPEDQITHGNVRIDRIRHRAFVDDRELDLTPTEFRLLEIMLKSPGRAFTRQQLMDGSIGEGAVVLERTIDVHVKTLRRKMGEIELIETVRGVGYRLKE